MSTTTIKEARGNLGLTQKKMSKMLNTPLSTYIKWENGKRRTPGIALAVVFVVERDESAKDALLAEYT